jgi:cathepsin A (carboxypeptidase C)
MNWSGKKEYAESKENIWLLSGKRVGRFQSHGNLTRLVLYDAGHMVPFDVPEVSFKMLDQWINSHQ